MAREARGGGRGPLRPKLPWLVLAATLVASPPAFGDDPPDHRQIQVRLFKLRHQTSDDVFGAIKHLGSGRPGTKIEETSAFESISVRDYPRNVTAIANAIAMR